VLLLQLLQTQPQITWPKSTNQRPPSHYKRGYSH